MLLRRAGKGDEEAFTLLYRRHQAALYRFALRMSGNAWTAEEIVQDVFMTLMRDPKKFDPERGTLGAFLYGITHGISADQSARAAGYLSQKVILQIGARLHHGTREYWDECLSNAQ